MEIVENSNADELLKKVARKKAALIISAILAKGGSLNLGLNLDLRVAKFQRVLVLMCGQCNQASHEIFL